MTTELIVLRRSEPEPEPKKGGVWKIAHADFMTALMAFFLIMWLVNATDEEIQKSIANYFNPLNLVASPTDQKGVREPDETTAPATSGDEAGVTTGRRPMGADVAGDGGGASGGGNVEEGNDNTMASAGILTATDGPEFHDPYAALASEAAALDPEAPVAVDVIQSTLGAPGETAQSDDVRDPFDPAFWQTSSPRVARALQPGAERTADAASAEALDARARRPSEASAPAPEPAPTDASVAEAASEAAAPRSTLAEAILAEHDAQSRATAANAEVAAAAGALQSALAGTTAAVAVGEGATAVLVSLTDGDALSMFAIGSADPTRDAEALFARVAEVLRSRDGRIVIRGHTDARPFRDGTSDNWMLSFARAHATKEALVAGGVPEERFARVEGLADREPARLDNPLADENRRIEILYEPATPAGEPASAEALP